jgi:hypothetical protein
MDASPAASPCCQCHSTDVRFLPHSSEGAARYYRCHACGHVWTIADTGEGAPVLHHVTPFDDQLPVTGAADGRSAGLPLRH